MSATIAETPIFTIAGGEYAFGLDWVAAGPVSTTGRQIARLARDCGATHLCRRRQSAQLGLARINRPRRFGQAPWRAAASAFADLPQPPAEPHCLLAAFTFQSGEIWIVAADNGRLFRDGDRLFRDMEQAREHFQTLYHRVHRWGTIVAPREWGYPRAAPRDPSEVLQAQKRTGLTAKLSVRSRPGTALNRISRRGAPSIAEFGAAAGIAAALIIAGKSGLLHRHGSAPATQAYQPVVAPWFPEIDDLDALSRQCVALIGMAADRSSIPGWDIGAFACDRSGATADLSARSYVPLSEMREYAKEASLQSSQRTGQLTWPAAQMPPKRDLVQPLPGPDALLERFGQLDEHARASNAFMPPVAPGEPAPEAMGVQRPRPYRKMTWEFRTAAPPSLWRAELAEIPDIEISRLILKRSEGGWNWIVNGVAYVSP